MDNSAIVMELMAAVIMSEDKNAMNSWSFVFYFYIWDAILHPHYDRAKYKFGELCSRLVCSISSYIEMQVH